MPSSMQTELAVGENTREELAAVTRLVRRHAHSGRDERELLDVLGLGALAAVRPGEDGAP